MYNAIFAYNNIITNKRIWKYFSILPNIYVLNYIKKGTDKELIKKF